MKGIPHPPFSMPRSLRSPPEKKKRFDPSSPPQQSTEGPGTLAAREEERMGPTLRANLFPEVTDLFCRLPLSTLFYRLEAANLGDLLRL